MTLTFEQLTGNDQREIRQFQKFMRLKRTKRGRKYLSTQSYWKGYLGLANEKVNSQVLENFLKK